MKKLYPTDSILIPDGAVREYGGSLFDVYSWNQEQFDGSYKKFEMIKRTDAVEIFVVKDGQILVLHEEQPHRGQTINLPSGHLEPGETWLQGAERELAEETGLVCDTWKLIHVSQPNSKMEWFVGTFVATDISASRPQTVDAGEKIEMQWYEFDDLRRRILDAEFKDMHYLMPFFVKVKSIEELLSLHVFEGSEVDRDIAAA